MTSHSEEELEELIRRSLSANREEALRATWVLFRDVVEPNCDSFDPMAVQEYAALFARVIARVLPGYREEELLSRYERVRRITRYEGRPKRVCVLSRVTLGADVAVTSVLLDAAKRRFPEAEICLAGPAKNLELFSGDERITQLVVPYGRAGSLRERLLASESVREMVDRPGTLVLDPDSRLTQLGLIPVTGEDRYLFFESRAYDVESNASLATLTAQWAGETLGVEGARAYLSPAVQPSRAAITVSLGVGENEEKRAGRELEFAAIFRLASLGVPMLIDRGAGGGEGERVDALVRELGNRANLQVHHGSFASFAAQIMQSRLYFGYDSAGQHVAAASGVPLVTVFAGYACERTFYRWRPTGPGPIHIIRAGKDRLRYLAEDTLAALTSAAAEAGLS